MESHLVEARRPRHKTHRRADRPPFDSIALLLQGGGALGAYQAGVYEGLAEAGLHPDWVAGISIGAINSAIIAGNAEQARLDMLRGFWECVTAEPLWGWASSGQSDVIALFRRALREWWSPVFEEFWKPFGVHAPSTDPGEWFAPRGDVARSLANEMNAILAAAFGAPHFFAPRPLSPWLQPVGTLEATSYFDASFLKATLERFVDFERINAGETRFSVGAVNVATGNFVYFDNTTDLIRPEHVMASGALPPGFPAVEIEGEHYWDGGLVSNTPLQWVLECEPRQDTLAFQVDLWNARGALPRTMAEVATRQKEIQYSSRTRANSDRFKTSQNIRNALSDLLSQVPEELRQTREYELLRPVADRKVYNIIQLIYRSKGYEGGSKDFEFSAQSMREHWRAGYQDTSRTLRHPEVLQRPTAAEGVFTFDLGVHGRE
jgi:NTE family protein